MSIVPRFLSSGRLREARRRLAEDPSAVHYEALAAEHARLGELDEALRVCLEGLELVPSSAELKRLAERARTLKLEDRTRTLTRELREAPRPALYRELCDILLTSGRVARAEECAIEWHRTTGDVQALHVKARARLERFFADRRREDGKLAAEFIEAGRLAAPSDDEPLRLALELYSRAGAWADAYRTLGQLLQVKPGDPALEARYRTLSTTAEKAPSFEQALRAVEKTGELADEQPLSDAAPAATAIRPLLQELGAEKGTLAALYTRGSTALVQGPKGATAERTARAVREVVQCSRTAARRLGLGVTEEIQLEGDFGALIVAPSELGAAALWCTGPVDETRRERVRGLRGAGSAAPAGSPETEGTHPADGEGEKDA